MPHGPDVGGNADRFMEAAERNAAQVMRTFRAALPTGRHLFFLDAVRPIEHFFAVHFVLQKANVGQSNGHDIGTAFFAFHDTSRRVRRAVNQDRDALTHACFKNRMDLDAIGNISSESSSSRSAMLCNVDAWKARLVDHLESKHYPAVSKIEYVGTGHMATLGELYIHTSREDLVRELRQDISNSKKKSNSASFSPLERLDLDLMLDVLSIKSCPPADSGVAAAVHTGPCARSSHGNASAHDSFAISEEEAARRPTTIAATVLVFDTDWNIVNGDAIAAGVSDTKIGAVSLEESDARATQLWLDDDRIRAKWGGDRDMGLAIGRKASKGPSAPDPGFCGIESDDMVLSSKSGLQRDWCAAVLDVAESTMKNRLSSKYR